MNNRRIIHDPLFLGAVACAPLFWLIYACLGGDVRPPGRVLQHLPGFLLIVLLYPVLEEIVFRGGIQEYLRGQTGAQAWKGLSLANVLTSLLFSAAHLIHHVPTWAAAVFFPSLVFGFFKDRHVSLTSPIFLHVFYNAGFALLFIPFQAA